MIKLFVFDLGNVILPFDAHPISRQLHGKSRARQSITAEEIHEYIFDLDGGSINGYEEGLSSSLQFFADIRDRYELDLDFAEFKDIWNNIFQESPAVNEAIVHLKTHGFPLFLLSNTNELHFSHVIERYPIVHLMDEWILSFEVGAKKPKKRMYEAIFEKMDVDAHEVFYIDDMVHYIEVGRNMGMDGLVFRDPSDLWKALRDRGI